MTTTKPARAGIGAKLDLAIRARFEGEAIDPAKYAYERGKQTKHPREYIGPRGSANHKLVAVLLDMMSGRGGER